MTAEVRDETEKAELSMETAHRLAEQRVLICEYWHKDQAAAEADRMATAAGFPSSARTLIATATAELVTNILRYAGTGELILRICHDGLQVGIEICAVDHGAGIENVEMAMQDHFTTTPGSLGLGLPSVRRIMDDFEIDSAPGLGTRVLARKWRNLEQY